MNDIPVHGKDQPQHDQSKFCPNLADKTKPLWKLLNKSNEWTWRVAQESLSRHQEIPHL